MDISASRFSNPQAPLKYPLSNSFFGGFTSDAEISIGTVLYSVYVTKPLSFFPSFFSVPFDSYAITSMIWGKFFSSTPSFHFFILSCTQAIVIFLLFYSIWLICINLNVLGKHFLFLPTITLFILQCRPLLVVLFLFYSIWLFLINLNGIGRHFLFLPTTALFSTTHCPSILILIFLLYDLCL